MKRSMTIIALAAVSVVLLGIAGFVWRVSIDDVMVVQEPIAVEKIRIANIGMFSVFNVIAKERGYFTENGLDAQIDEYDSGATSIAALHSGEADIAIAADFVGVRSMFERNDVRVLAQVSDHDVFRVIARRDKGIEVPSDLRRKTIGLTKRTAGEFYLGRFLTLNGIASDEVMLVDLPPAEMIGRIEAGTIDAIVIFEPHAYAIGETLGGQVVTWSAQGSQHALGMAYATDDFIKRHPETVKRYLRSLVQAERYLQENNREAQALVAKALGYSDSYIWYVWPRFSFGILLEQGTLLSMEEQARWIIGEGLVDAESTPNFLDRFAFDMLEAVKPSGVLIVH